MFWQPQEDRVSEEELTKCSCGHGQAFKAHDSLKLWGESPVVCIFQTVASSHSEGVRICLGLVVETG